MAQFDLNKQQQRVAFVLQKRNLPAMRASVGLTLDVSGSMEDLFKRGTVQRLLEQIIPVALKADDNGNLDVYTFSDDSHNVTQVTGATVDNFQGFVKKEILHNPEVDLWNGTDYKPVVKKMLEDYGFYGGGSDYNKTLNGGQQTITVNTAPPEKKGFFSKLFGGTSATAVASKPSNVLQKNSASGEAVINYFITDGENSDQDETYRLMKQIQDAGSNMYFLFIGIGHANFRFIEKLGNDFSNVGFVNIKDLQTFVDSDDIYEQLIPEEMTKWLAPKSV